MKLKASVAAVLLAVSGTAAWAGDAPEPNEPNQHPAAAVVDQAADAAADAPVGWRYVNGEAGAPEAQKDSNQEAATSLGFTESDQAAAPAGESGGDPAPLPDSEQARGQQDDVEQNLGPDDDGRTMGADATEPESTDTEDMSADANSPNDEPAVGENASESSAGSADESSSERSAQSEDEGSNDQSAQAEDDSSDQGVQSQDPAATLEGKVVVIIPRGWQGSIPDLITALESSPDAKDIVVVQPGDPQAGNSGLTDEYSADRNRPAATDRQ